MSLALLRSESEFIHVVDNLLALLMSLSLPPKLQKVLRLDSKQATLNRGGPAQSP
jgi:hypothetical protein